MGPANRINKGFTLIEVVITVVIVGLLAAVALPSYLSFVQKGRRADAFDAITLVQQQQERFRSQNAQYAETLADLRLSSTSSAGHYRLTLSDSSALGYTLTVAPVSGGKQRGDTGCQELKVVVFKASSQRQAKDAGGGDSTARCWPQ